MKYQITLTPEQYAILEKAFKQDVFTAYGVRNITRDRHEQYVTSNLNDAEPYKILPITDELLQKYPIGSLHHATIERLTNCIWLLLEPGLYAYALLPRHLRKYGYNIHDRVTVEIEHSPLQFFKVRIIRKPSS